MKDLDEVVNHPTHYELEGLGVEVIDVIRSVLGEISFCSYCKGNVIKYILRADKKNGLEDLQKARVYLSWLIATIESEEHEEEDQDDIPVVFTGKYAEGGLRREGYE